MAVTEPNASVPVSKRAIAGRLVLESAVIIASILAAFALDTWWGSARERSEERETLQALHTEFSAARENILFYRSIQERILTSVTSVTDSLQLALARGDDSVELPDTALSWAYIPPTTTVSLGTLDGLISSGRLGIIRDRRLRSSLGSWGKELAELAEEEADSRNLAYGDLDRTLRTRMNTYGLWTAANRLNDGTLSAEGRKASRLTPVDTEVLGVFHLRQSILFHAIDEFDPLVAEVDSILALIEGSL
jgi:hypothetical protein